MSIEYQIICPVHEASIRVVKINDEIPKRSIYCDLCDTRHNIKDCAIYWKIEKKHTKGH